MLEKIISTYREIAISSLLMASKSKKAFINLYNHVEPFQTTLEIFRETGDLHVLALTILVPILSCFDVTRNIIRAILRACPTLGMTYVLMIFEILNICICSATYLLFGPNIGPLRTAKNYYKKALSFSTIFQEHCETIYTNIYTNKLYQPIIDELIQSTSLEIDVDSMKDPTTNKWVIHYFATHCKKYINSSHVDEHSLPEICPITMDYICEPIKVGQNTYEKQSLIQHFAIASDPTRDPMRVETDLAGTCSSEWQIDIEHQQDTIKKLVNLYTVNQSTSDNVQSIAA